MENILRGPELIVLENAHTQDSAAILWEKVSGAAGYEVFVEDEFYATTENTDYTIEGLEPDGEYEVYIIAIGDDGQRMKSRAVVLHTAGCGRVLDITDYGAVPCEIDNPVMADTQ